VVFPWRNNGMISIILYHFRNLSFPYSPNPLHCTAFNGGAEAGVLIAMDLYFRCKKCSMTDVWRIKVHGSRPMARTMLSDIHCPDCGMKMDETYFEGIYNIHDLRRRVNVK
jgi:hypothetical protein